MFSDQEIAERYADLFYVMDGFCAAYNAGSAIQAEIDTSALYLAVVAIYDDITRYKEYHLPDPQRQKSNAVKRAAFAARWLVRFSPLIFPQTGHISGQSGVKHDGLINALFAVYYALLNLEMMTGNRLQLNDDLLYSIIYDLTYRHLTGESLALSFELIVMAATGVSIIVSAPSTPSKFG